MALASALFVREAFNNFSSHNKALNAMYQKYGGAATHKVWRWLWPAIFVFHALLEGD